MKIASALRQHTDILIYPGNIIYLALGKNELKPLIREKLPWIPVLKRRFKKANRKDSK